MTGSTKTTKTTKTTPLPTGRASAVKTVKVDPSAASTAASLPADLWANLAEETAATMEAAKAKRAKARAAKVKLTADELANLKSVNWGIPTVGEYKVVEFKVVASHYVTPLTAFYNRVVGILRANGSVKLSDIAKGYSIAIKTNGLEKIQSRMPILQQIANRMGKNIRITENLVHL